MQKKKSYMTIMTGILNKEIHVNDIGSPYLHKRHKVTIAQFEKTKIGRAVVLDQHMIDTLFLENHLDAQQHNVCDKYLGLISKSGCFVQTPQLDKILFTGKKSSASESRSCILIGVQRKIKEEVGIQKERVFWKLMISNSKKINALEVMIVQECANALLNYWYVSQQSPVSLFQQALSNHS